MSNQERRLMRRMAGRGGHGVSPGGIYLPQGAYSPQDEQDAKRDRLAERLIEIGLDSARMDGFTDTAEKPVGTKGYDTEPVITLEEWYLKHAHAALAAAEVIYPELPEPQMISAGPLPAAAQEGAQSVAAEGPPAADVVDLVAALKASLARVGSPMAEALEQPAERGGG